MEKWSTPERETVPEAPSFGYLDAVPTAKHPVAVPMLLPGTMLNVHTRNTLYRLVVVNGPARQISITGGRLFPRGTDVRLLGALDGEEAVKEGWIVEGLPLQLITPNGPVITSIVESVDVDIDPASLSGDDTD